MRTFILYRSGIGPLDKDPSAYNPPEEPQLQGCVFDDGKVAVRWMTPHRSTVVWDSWDDFVAVHIEIHPDYATRVVWQDSGLTEVF